MAARFRIIAVLLVQMCICFAVPAQEKMDSIVRNFELFGVKDGLSQGYTTAVIQDKQGYMWFGTMDGLNRYDGYHVTIYRHDPEDPYSLPDNYISRLAEDDNGNIWVGTGTKGLCLFDRKTGRSYRVNTDCKDSFTTGDINVLKYKDGKLLVEKSWKLYMFDVSKVAPGNYGKIKLHEVFNYQQLLAENGYKAVWAGLGNMPVFNTDSIWVGDSERIFLCTHNNASGKWDLVFYPIEKFGLHHGERFYPFYQLPGTGKMVIGDYNDLSVYNIVTGTLEYTRDLRQSATKSISLYPDLSGAVAIENGRTFYFNPDSHELKTISSNFLAHYHNVAKTPGNIFWIGTSGTGALKYDSSKELFHNRKVFCYLYEMDSAGYHLGNANDKGTIHDIHDKDDRKVKKITSLGHISTHGFAPLVNIGGARDVLWVSGNRYYPDGVHVVKLMAMQDKAIRYDSVLWGFTNNGSGTATFTDHAGRQWFCNKDTSFKPLLVVLNENTRKIEARYYFPVQKEDGNASTFLSAVWQDKSGTLWLGTLRGLFSFNAVTESWHHWKNNPADSSSLSSDLIFSVCADGRAPEKYLWVGTNGGGLNRFEYATGKCTHYSVKDGLPNDVIYGILTDEQNNLWFSSNGGLTCFNPYIPEGAPGRLRTFTDEDGLPGNEFNHYEYFKSANGDMTFGGTMGYTTFKPSEVLRLPPPPNVVLTGFSLFNKPFDYKTDTTILSGPIEYADVIHLPHNKNMFTISFAVLDYSAPSKKHYKYILEGFDNEWIDNGTSNSATFTNLDPGEYIFRVTASVKNGNWNEKGASIHIIIDRPWWATWWFRTFIIVAVATGGYALYKYRVNQLLKVERLRNTIALNLHDDIGSTLSSISLYAAVLKKKATGLSDESNALVDKMISNTSEIMENMNDIVWATKEDMSSFEPVIDRMRNFAVEMTEVSGIELMFMNGEGTNKLMLQMQQRKNIYMFYKEAVNNAIKHSGCSRLTIEITYASGILKVAVRDNGKGFSDGGTTVSDGNGGSGLLGMKFRADQIGATLKFTSAPGKGTEVSLALAVK